MDYPASMNLIVILAGASRKRKTSHTTGLNLTQSTGQSTCNTTQTYRRSLTTYSMTPMFQRLTMTSP